MVSRMGQKVYDDFGTSAEILTPPEASFLTQYISYLKVVFLLRRASCCKNLCEIFLPVLFVIGFALIYIIAGGLGSQREALELIGENATLPQAELSKMFCLDPHQSLARPSIFSPLPPCPANCSAPCSVAPQPLCRSLILPGVCALRPSIAVPCTNLPTPILSFDPFTLYTEQFSADVDDPFGLIAISASPALFLNGRPAPPLERLLATLNASFATFSPLLSEGGPWRQARQHIINATPVGEAVGLQAAGWGMAAPPSPSTSSAGGGAAREPGWLVFADASDARDYARDNEGAVFAVIEFETVTLGTAAGVTPAVTPSLKYTIRLNNTATVSTLDRTVQGAVKEEKAEAACKYASSGFMVLQHAIDTTFAALVAEEQGVILPDGTQGNETLVLGVIGNMPLPPRYKSTVLVVMSGLSSFMFLLAFMLNVQSGVSNLVMERESGMQEAILVMGVRRAALYASHATVFILYSLITGALCALGMVIGVFPTVAYLAIFLPFVGFELGVYAFAFLLSTFFSKARIASTVAPLLYLALLLLFTILSAQDTKVGDYILAPLMMSPFGRLINWFLPAAQRHLPVGLSDYFGSSYVIGALVQLYFLAFIYFVIAVYLDHVLPSACGAPLPPWFPFLPSYWAPGTFGRTESFDVNNLTNPAAGNGLIEPMSLTWQAAVRVRLNNLRKIFGSGSSQTVAVDGLSLEVCEGHITILLGHNGAGKTTTVSMLTGLIPVTGGDATVYGHSIVRNMTQVRRSLGLCPQKNVIWPELTVRQHLNFYSKVKGVVGKDVEATVEAMAVKLGIADKIDSPSGGLSGGQKRKLCVAIALIGNSRVVFLDEPTAGMDVQSRLAMWKMLQTVKKGRVILMSTHYMDEAEQLGDRVALMSHGKLHSCGTPLFLKQRLGVGYHLAVSMVEPSNGTAGTGAVGQSTTEAAQLRGKSMGVSAEAAARAAAAAEEVHRRKFGVIALVRQYVPESEIITDVGCELSMRLPMQSVSRFSTLFDALDGQKSRLGMRSYAISPTTLEEVFLRVAADVASAGNKLPAPGDGALTASDRPRRNIGYGDQLEIVDMGREDPQSPVWSVQSALPPVDEQYSPGGGGGATQQRAATSPHTASHAIRPAVSLTKGNPDAPATGQIMPLLMKRIHASRRDKKLICMTVLMPLIFCAICAGLMQLGPPDLTPLQTGPVGESDIYVARRAAGGAPASSAFTFNSLSDDIRVLDAEHDPNSSVAPGGMFLNSSEVSRWMARTMFDHGDRARQVALVYDDLVWYDESGSAMAKMLGFGGGSEPNVFGGGGPPPTMTMMGPTMMGPTTPGPMGIPPFGYQPPIQRAVPFTIISNGTAYHSAPFGLSLYTNGLVNATVGGSLTAPSIITTNHPLPRSKAFEQEVNSAIQFVSSMLLVAPFLILPSAFASQAVKERETKAKHLQYISGASSPAYWATYFVVDCFMFHIASTVALIAFLLSSWGGLTYAEWYVYDWAPFWGVAALLTAYGFCVIPFGYVIGLPFKSHSAIAMLMATAGIVVGFLMNFGIMILTFFVDWWEILEGFFRVFPHYNLANGMLRVAAGGAFDDPGTVFTWGNDTGIIKPLLALVLSVPFWWLLLLLSELGVTARFSDWIQSHAANANISSKAKQLAHPPDDEDPDVADERHAVISNARPLDRLRVVDLVKVFSGWGVKTKVAVAGVTFGVRQDEVFAFLGTNGAGKTTTISILGGEFEPSYGSGYVDGYDVVKERDMARRNMGYCPQFDAVLDNLNTDEHMDLYGGLRGLSKEAINRDRETLIRILGLTPHRLKPAADLSGGNKRKLSIALSLIGAPAVIFLDEPSAGLDPVARRALWDALGSLTRGCSVVLTTHHLEEVEALSQRVGIMVDGRLVCVGPLSHLKQKFGKGYEVQLSCAGDGESEVVAGKLMRMFPNSSVVAADGSRRTVEVPNQSATLGALFRSVEQLKLQHTSLDFAIGVTSLEQVFVRVSKETEETAAAAAYENHRPGERHPPPRVSGSRPNSAGGAGGPIHPGPGRPASNRGANTNYAMSGRRLEEV